jgi:hypothetical protein
VAPVLTANQLATTLVLSRTATVLGGAATDGGPSVNVSVRVQPPIGDEFRADTRQTGSDWSFDLTATERGRYELWVDAEDQAGNRTDAGPFGVDVTCTDAFPVVVALSAEPSVTAPPIHDAQRAYQRGRRSAAGRPAAHLLRPRRSHRHAYYPQNRRWLPRSTWRSTGARHRRG